MGQKGWQAIRLLKAIVSLLGFFQFNWPTTRFCYAAA